MDVRPQHAVWRVTRGKKQGAGEACGRRAAFLLKLLITDEASILAVPAMDWFADLDLQRRTFSVGTAQLWSWGTPEAIRAEVRERIATVGRGGGLIISPAYDLEPAEGIPWANVQAFFDAVDEFGTD